MNSSIFMIEPYKDHSNLYCDTLITHTEAFGSLME